MKKILLYFFAFVCVTASAQIKHSCCSSSSTEKFAMLASNEKFASAHLEPVPFDFIAASGSMITYTAGDGKNANAFIVKSNKPTNNWIIMIHEWWGLNDYIKQEAEKLQAEVNNANVLAIDLYDGNVASTKEQAQTFMSGLKEERAVSIIKGAIAFTGRNAKIFTIGWCMGGAWSLQASILAGKQAAGCVMYYGMPETDLNKLKDLNADVLGIFAQKDQWINQQVVDKFIKNMETAGKRLIIKSYDADHAFANPSNPKYDKAASADAHQIVLSFLKERMKN